MIFKKFSSFPEAATALQEQQRSPKGRECPESGWLILLKCRSLGVLYAGCTLLHECRFAHCDRGVASCVCCGLFSAEYISSLGVNKGMN